MKNRNDKYITIKANNTEPIRVLYKKVGEVPKVMIIDNLFKLKRFIVQRNLDIIPYQTAYIICNNKELMKNMTPNIVFSFNSIKGDFILVNIDKNKREFKSLTQEDITWYASDLMNKSFNNIDIIKISLENILSKKRRRKNE
ncbi:MAG: hypothetical protein J6A36_01725 [Clostridia bacterium]|nr:hypothetical protein [Clostridia bacterium]